MAAPGPKYWCHGLLRIMDAPHLHEEIILTLGEGDECHRKGDEIPDRPGKTWGNDICLLETKISERHEIPEHLNWLCDFIRPHEDKIRRWISEGARVDLYFSYACNDDHRGFSIPGDSLSIFSRLNISFEVSIMT
jgi:hypothetical protein